MVLNMNDFGERLKNLRLQAGITQKQLAERLWLSKATVSYYEQSLRSPSPEILVKLSKIFKVSTDYLLGIEKDEKKLLNISDLTDEEIEVLEKTVMIFRKNKKLKNN